MRCPGLAPVAAGFTAWSGFQDCFQTPLAENARPSALVRRIEEAKPWTGQEKK
jgi:hypothetical protein